MNIKSIKFVIGICILSLLPFYPKSVFAAELIDPIGNWSQTTNLPYKLSGQSSIVLGNHIFIFSGSAETWKQHAEILEGIQDVNGKILNWSTNARPVKTPLNGFSLVKFQNRVFMLGGFEENSSTNFMGSISRVNYSDFSNGQLSTWTQTADILEPVWLLGSALVNNKYLFVSGGYNSANGSSSNRVYEADISNGGDLVWRESTPLPDYKISAHQMVSFKNYLYVIGGRNEGGDFSKVYRASVDNLGKIAKWETDQPLPTNNESFSIQRVGDYILVVGGQSRGTHFSSTQYTRIKDDGSLEPWKTSVTALPYGICCGSSVVLNGFIYQIGGWSEEINSNTNKVYVSKLNIPSDDPPPPPTVAKTPIILIPGTTACWNYDALVHSEAKENKDWKLGFYAAPYTRIIQALENAGYEKDKQLFVYCYDWRKSPVEDVPELDSLVNEVLIKNPTVTKVNIIGHSMGGLIGADYVSKYAQKVDKLVAAGSPFKGSANAYRVWEGADLTMYKGFEKIGVDLLMQVNIPKYPNKATEIRHMIPSVQSLLPIYDFIKKPSGKFTPWQEMIWHNEYLPTLNSSSILPKLSTVVGIGNDTIKSIQVKPRGGSSTKLEEWVDGEPTKMEYEMGDGSVLSESSMIGGIKNITLTGVDHFEVITSPTAQEEIMKLLGIEGRGVGDTIPKYRNALVVTVASPVTFQLITPDNTIVPSTDNLIVVDNPISGNYQVSVNGVSTGKYKIYFGRLSENTQAWDQINGIINIIGENKVSTFYVDMDAEHLGSDPINNATEEIDRLIGLLGTTQLDKSMTNFWEAKLLNLKKMILQKPTPIQNVMISLENFVSEKSDMGVWINMNPALRSEFEGGLRLISSWVTG